MSVKMTDALWRRVCEGQRKLLLMAICDCADDEGRAFPSQHYLAWKTDLARSTIALYLKEFYEKGILVSLGRRADLEKSVAGNSEKNTAVIKVQLEKLPEKKPWRVQSSVVQRPDVQARDVSPQPRDIRSQSRDIPSDHRNKEEPSLEPSLEPSERTPDNLHPVAYATKLLEELSMTHVRSNITSACAALELLIREGKGKAAAYEFLLAMALDAHDRGELVDRWWFTDAKWKQVNGGPKRGQSRNEASNAAIERAFEDTAENP